MSESSDEKATTATTGKYGPGPPAPAPETAAARLEAYGRAVRAAQTHKEGAPQAPILQLADEQLAGLFAPRQLEGLVARPLSRAQIKCEPSS